MGKTSEALNGCMEKIKVSNAEIVVHGTKEKPYYEIKYRDLADGQVHIGYSSYDLDNVFGWLEECFETVKENERGVIGEQVKELRNYERIFKGDRIDGNLSCIFGEAADTIETLFAKLAAANIEYSVDYTSARARTNPPKEGNIVQHFKREFVKDKEHSMKHLYIIEAIATHTETNEKLVVYRALYKDDKSGEYNVFARPYNAFMAEVDQEKYPQIKQRYRFELFENDKS